MHLVKMTVWGLLLMLAIACGGNQGGDVPKMAKNGAPTNTGSSIAWEGQPLTDQHRSKLKGQGLNPSDYQFHRVAPDGDCAHRVAMLQLLVDVLIEHTPRFEEFAKRVRDQAAMYQAKDTKFAPHARIEEALAAIRKLQGKSLKELLVWMNDQDLEQLLITHFSRPMLAAEQFLVGLNELNALLQVTGLAATYQHQDLTSSAVLENIGKQVGTVITGLGRNSEQEQKKFLTAFSDKKILGEHSRYEMKEKGLGLAGSHIKQALHMYQTALKGSRGLYQSKAYRFYVYGLPEDNEIYFYRVINSERSTAPSPSKPPLFVATQTYLHVDLLIRKDALVD